MRMFERIFGSKEERLARKNRRQYEKVRRAKAHNANAQLWTLFDRHTLSDSDCTRIEALLKQGGDPNMEREKGFCLLHFACMRGCTKIIAALLESGADPDKQLARADSSGSTPLLIASQFGYLEATRQLLNAGADPMKAEIYSATHFFPQLAGQRVDPLRAATNAGHAEVVALLLEHFTKRGQNATCRSISDQ